MITTVPQKGEVYPARIFRCTLAQLMKAKGYSDRFLCELLNVVPLTARRVREGKDLKLSEAMKIARHFNMTVEEIWRLRQ